MMTCAERMRRIRLMEKMNQSNRTEKADDGTMKYYDNNGNVMITAKMVQRGETQA